MRLRWLLAGVAGVWLLGCSSDGGAPVGFIVPQWGRIQGDSRNTGAGYDLTSNTGALRLRLDLGGAVSTTPVIDANGLVYVVAETRRGSEDDRVIAINFDTSTRWVFPAEGGAPIGAIRSSPAVDREGRVYFGTEAGQVFALETDGTTRWCFDVQERLPCGETPGSGAPAVRTSPVLDVDTVENRVSAVFVGTSAGEVIAIGADAGELRWRATTGGAIVGSPALDTSGVLFVASAEGRLHGFTRQGSMTLQFPSSATLDVAASPSTGVDTVFQLARDDQDNGQVVAVTTDGSPRWSAPFPLFAGPTAGTAFITRFVLNTAIEELVVVDAAGSGYVVEQNTGRAAGLCDGGDDAGDPCESDADCGGAVCDPVLFALGDRVEAAPIAGSDGTIVVPTAPEDGAPARVAAFKRRFCLSGDRIGEPCRRDDQCPGNPASTCLPEDEDERAVIPLWSFTGWCVGGDREGELCAADSECGNGGRCARLGAVRSNAAMAGDGTIYVGSDDGYLYALGASQ
jgi:outer membrane protein assembly factor BamB